MSTSQRVSWVFSTFLTLTVPTLLWAGEDKESVLAKCKLKAMELYTRKESQDAVVRASEYVVTCMIAAGYRIDPTKESACYGSPTIPWCFIPR
jgi:hypothetical protein